SPAPPRDRRRSSCTSPGATPTARWSPATWCSACRPATPPGSTSPTGAPSDLTAVSADATSPRVDRMDSFAGKVAVVTGAASGIGKALATRFGDEGMRVVMADVERPVLEAAAAELGERIGAGNVLAVPTDVRDDAA